MKTKNKLILGIALLLASIASAMTMQELLDAVNAAGIDAPSLTTTLKTALYTSAISDIDVQIQNIQAKIAAQNQPLLDEIQALRVKRADLVAAQSKG